MEKKGLISISQPTFLPWSGYFDLIDTVEKFVFLNDVQFSKQSWQQRNKIISDENAIWVTIPVYKNKGFSLINETKIFREKKEIRKFIKTIRQNYFKSKYFHNYFEDFVEIFENSLKLDFLDKFNIEIIKWFMEKIGIKTQIFISSDLKISKKRSLKIIDICKQLNSSVYISNHSANEYLKEDIKFFYEEKIRVFLHNYNTQKYNQNSKNFNGQISMLDMLFNEGPNCLSIIRSGRNVREEFFYHKIDNQNI